MLIRTVVGQELAEHFARALSFRKSRMVSQWQNCRTASVVKCQSMCMMTHPRAATKAPRDHIGPTTSKNPPSQRFRILISSSINQPTCFTLRDLANRAINPFLSWTYTDTSSLLIKQPEYSRHLHSELLAFPTVNLPLCLPQKKSHRNWRRFLHCLLRGVRMYR
jgi:hypothetical protein